MSEPCIICLGCGRCWNPPMKVEKTTEEKVEELVKKIQSRLSKPIKHQGHHGSYPHGYKDALEWVLGKLEKIEKEDK